MNDLWLPRGWEISETHLSVNDGITEEQAAEGIKVLTRLGNVLHGPYCYWIGDAINAMERLFPNKYEQWVEFTPYVIGTLRNYAYMCSRVPRENRGICPIQHTMTAAKIKDPAEQKQALRRCDKEGLSATEFRRMLAGEDQYKRKALPDRAGGFETAWKLNEYRWVKLSTMEMAKDVWEMASRSGKYYPG